MGKRFTFDLQTIYALLAACTLSTVGGGLWYASHLSDRYEEAIEETRAWTQRVGAIRDLGDLGLAVSATGRDIEMLGNTALLRAEQDAAAEAFRTQAAIVLADVRTATTPEDGAVILAGVKGMEAAVVEIQAASAHLMRDMARGESAHIAKDLVAMDAASMRLLQHCTTATRAARAMSLATQARHLDAARRAGASRFVLAGLVALAACALLVMGLRIGRLQRDQAEALAESHAAAERANRLKSAFLANMSHELRTPLNAIIGYAELVREDREAEGDTAAVTDLQRIERAGKHLLALINDLLDLSRIEAGQTRLAVSEQDFDALMAEVLETVRPAAQANGTLLSLIQEEAMGLVRTDATKVRQCLLNLLSNAAKFTEDGRIDVRVSRRGELVVVAVADTGIGMAEEQLQKLFTPFVQADASIATKYGGTGLGLAITRSIAQILGGDVSVTSAPGAGSTFTLTFAAGLERRPEAPKPAADAPIAVLIEDEADARDLIARALERAGFAVKAAASGEQGLALVEAHPDLALVVLDLLLPDRPGLDILDELSRAGGAPVIAISADCQMEGAVFGKAARFLPKPIDRDALSAAALMFARRRAPQSDAARHAA